MIEVQGLTKIYGSHAAVNNISFTVNEGEILGFLGPNGAGKTTTMNMMTGFISSTDGSVKINGYDILQEPIKAKKELGYLPDVPPLYGDMTVEEFLYFVCDLKQVQKSQRAEMIAEIMETVKISDVSKRVVKNLSKGYRQRVGLAQALVGYPPVLILDEPTVGLDPRQIIEMRDLIRSLGKKHTIILSSHILGEVSAVCDRIIIINKGEIVADAAADELTGNSNSTQLVTVRAERTEVEKALADCEFVDTLLFESQEEDCWNIRVSGTEEYDDIRELLYNAFVENNIPVLMMKPAGLSLEEVFLKVINGEYENKSVELISEEENSIETAEENPEVSEEENAEVIDELISEETENTVEKEEE